MEADSSAHRSAWLLCFCWQQGRTLNLCLPGTLQIWTCCFLSYPKYTCMVFLSVSMASWDTPLAGTIDLGTDSHRTGKNQAKMRRLLVNNFQDLRLTFGFRSATGSQGLTIPSLHMLPLCLRAIRTFLYPSPLSPPHQSLAQMSPSQEPASSLTA